jgi:plasmid replication initiation protein
MSSPSTHTRESRQIRRVRRRIAASVAAITMSGVAVVGAAVPAQAMPRSCNDIANTIEFFELAMDMDTGAYARYYATDYRYWNYEIRLYYSSGC